MGADGSVTIVKGIPTERGKTYFPIIAPESFVSQELAEACGDLNKEHRQGLGQIVPGDWTAMTYLALFGFEAKNRIIKFNFKKRIRPSQVFSSREALDEVISVTPLRRDQNLNLRSNRSFQIRESGIETSMLENYFPQTDHIDSRIIAAYLNISGDIYEHLNGENPLYENEVYSLLREQGLERTERSSGIYTSSILDLTFPKIPNNGNLRRELSEVSFERREGRRAGHLNYLFALKDEARNNKIVGLVQKQILVTKLAELN